MVVRFWSHTGVLAGWSRSSGPVPIGQQTLGLDAGARTTNDTVVRQLVDLQMTVIVYDDQPENPIYQWPFVTCAPIACGVSADTDTSPLRMVDQPPYDPRITGTGMLIPAVYGPTPANNAYMASYSMKQTLDTKGMRKSPVAGGKPVPQLDMIFDAYPQWLSQYSDWAVDVFGYWRILYETPS